jgi:hypothetical protein
MKNDKKASEQNGVRKTLKSSSFSFVYSLAEIPLGLFDGFCFFLYAHFDIWLHLHILNIPLYLTTTSVHLFGEC